MWETFLIISAIIFLFSVMMAVFGGKLKKEKIKSFDASKILFIGVIVSSVFLFIPIYYNIFCENGCGVVETILISAHNMIRLFVVDGEFDFITSNISGISPEIYRCYTLLFSVLFFLAPVLTFSFVLSFFKNISAYRYYITHYNSEINVFSELNERSVMLAKSLFSNDSKRRLFVFATTSNSENSKYSEDLKELRAVYLKKEACCIDFNFHSKKSALNFYAIGDNQSENLNQALKLAEKYKYRVDTNLYVFSTLTESELLLANAFETNDKENKPIMIKIRRINEIRSLINRNLYEKGFETVFSSAYCDGASLRQINALVIGVGKYGTEMTKALTWFCQMDGFDVEIKAFDIDKKAKEKFTSLCSELMKFSGKKDVYGESEYTISVYSDIDVDTEDFDEMIKKILHPTYVFVALGDDEKNISVSVKLRSLFARMNYNPIIQTVVYDTEKKKALENIKNFKGEFYNIDFIGDMETCYSEEVILNSEVEQEALKRHLKWGNEIEFWKYDYNYKSSVASSIHRKMKIMCKIPGIEKTPKERTESERQNLRVLEHRRWNTYIRSEGYVYCGTTEKSGRNDLAKTHNCLVPFGELPLYEQEKDDD